MAVVCKADNKTDCLSHSLKLEVTDDRAGLGTHLWSGDALDCLWVGQLGRQTWYPSASVTVTLISSFGDVMASLS